MNITILKNIFVYGVITFIAATSGYYAHRAYEEHIINVSEKSYQTGYTNGFTCGKENVEKVLRNEYQNFLYRMTEEKYDRKDIRQQILMERRVERIMNKSNSKLSEAKKNLFKQYIMRWANEYNLSPVFVASMIHRETNFNEKAVSKSNARGPMQVLAKWHPEKLKKVGIKEKDLHIINHGIHIGCMVIREYLDRANWNYREALKKYVGAVNNSADGYIEDIFKMTMYAYEEK